MTISKSEGQSDLTTLRALILGDGETPIDSFDAAERVKRWLDEHGWGKSTAYPPCQCNTPSDWWLHINALVAKRLPVLAWEQGRDAAAEAAMNDVCTGLPEAKLAHAVQYGVWHDKIDPLQAYIPIEAALAWGQRIMEAIRALTPPADLAGTIELPAKSGSDGQPTTRGPEVLSGGSPLPASERDANDVRSSRDSRERPATDSRPIPQEAPDAE